MRRGDSRFLFGSLPSVREAVSASSESALAEAVRSSWVFTDRCSSMPESMLVAASEAQVIDVIRSLGDERVDEDEGFEELVFVPRVLFRVESGCVRPMLGAGLDSLDNLFDADVRMRVAEPLPWALDACGQGRAPEANRRLVLFAHMPWNKVLGMKVWLGLGTGPFERHALVACILRTMTVFGLDSQEASAGALAWLESLERAEGDGFEAARDGASGFEREPSGDFARWSRSYEAELEEKLQKLARVRLLNHEADAARHLCWTAA